MVRLQNKEDLERARERLRGRDPESLGEFLMSLTGDSRPVDEQARTFIVGNDVAETVESIRQRIGGLSAPSEYEHRHARGREMGIRLNFIANSVEQLVLPGDPRAAFALLVALFEADANAMENCGDHAWEAECAYQRAGAVMAEAAKRLPPTDVARRISALIDGDNYGVHAALMSVFSEKLPTAAGAAP